MTTEMDETFTDALRAVLVDQVQREPPGHASGMSRWLVGPRRWITVAAAVLGVAAAGGGISYAAGAWSTLPGGDKVTDLSAPFAITATGSKTVELGKPPAGTTAINVAFSCLTAGRFTFADGSAVECDRADVARRAPPVTYTMATAPGQDSTTITATPGARWHLVATYVSARTTAWGVNASGQTYGVQNRHGVPDLVAVIATNHRSGYVYATQLSGPTPKTPAQAIAQDNAPPRTLTVYKSDGKTPIGKFVVGR